MWIDSNTARIASIEGLEKIIDLQNGFKEISYASIPLCPPVGSYDHLYVDKK